MTVNSFKVLRVLRSSFWFVPSVMVLGAAALSVLSIHVDFSVKEDVLRGVGFIYAGGPEGARSVLEAIAGSMITVAGVVFSMTVVILSLASQQFGPRILRTFIRDRSNQFVLGSFVATFVYCLLVQRTVRGATEGSTFVPYISVTVGIAFAVLSIGVLIFFVHHAASSIQATSIISAVARELDSAIDRLYPEPIGDPGAHEEVDIPDPAKGQVVKSRRTGYVQLTDGDEILHLASGSDALIVVVAGPGTFVTLDDPMARIYASGGPLPERVVNGVRGAFVVGEHRTEDQDLDFLFRQLTEIAVRALSPGTNDPFTAIEAVKRVGAALRRLAGRSLPSPMRRDEAGSPRLLVFPQPFTSIARDAFGTIRRYAASSQEVLSELLRGIRTIAPELRREEDRIVLREEASAVLAASAKWTDDIARRTIQQEYRTTVDELAGGLARMEG